MKTINIVKKLIIVYYYLVGLALVGSVLLPVVLLLDLDFSITILGNKTDLNSLGVYKSLTVNVLLVILLFFYFKSISFLKNSLKDLSEGNYFSELVINSFKKAGKYFLILAGLETIFKVIFSMILDYKLKIGFDSSIFLFIIIGLFLLFLGQVFTRGKELETDNSLTI